MKFNRPIWSIIITIIILIVSLVFAEEPPEVPYSRDALIYRPYDMGFGHYAFVEQPVYDILEEHGYIVIREIDRVPGANPALHLADFINGFNSKSGIIYFITHGSEEFGHNYVGMEFYDNQNDCINAVENYQEQYRSEYPQNVEEIIVMTQGLHPEHYSVSVAEKFIEDHISELPNSIIFAFACYSANLYPSFQRIGAKNLLGYADTEPSDMARREVLNFFYRMGGRDWLTGNWAFHQEEKRNKSVSEAFSETQNEVGGDDNFLHLGNWMNQRIYNSPRIVGLEVYQGFWLIYRYGFYNGGVFPEYPYWWDYPGDLSGCPRDSAFIGEQPIQVKILFSSLMDPGKIEVEIAAEEGNFSIPVSGYFTGGHMFNNDLWEGVCDFSEWSGGVNAIVRVDAEDAFEGDINARLDTDGDGNSDEEDTNHKFWVSVPPQVISTSPANGASDVDVYTEVTIAFNREMDQSTVNSGTVLFNPPLHGGFSTEWSGDGKTVTLTLTNPEEDLEFYTNYTVTVTDGVKDTSGVKLDGDRDGEPGGNYPFSFTTRLQEVTLSPKAFSVSITEGSGGYYNINIKNNEQRSISVNLDDDIANPGGWSTSSVSANYSLNASQTLPLSYSVFNDGAGSDLYHRFYLTSNGVSLDDAEHVYSPREEKEDDHPDEGPIVDPHYPTPWYLTTESNIGILLNGFFDGVGHLLGRYKISTCAVKKENLKVLGDQNRSLNDLSVLIIPSGGLIGLENVTSFKQGLKNFVEQGGNVVCLTQQYGYDFDALPDAPSGYGWREDQSCWRGAGYFSDWDVVLSGQDTVIIDAHIDGFFVDIPQNAKVIMKRRISGMPELFYYDYGLGKVLVCGLYTDWGYGRAQWSNAEVNLLRDIITWSMDTQRPIQEYYAGNEVSLDIPVYYHPDEDTMPANKVDIKVLNPNRDSIYSTEIPLSPPLYSGNSTEVNFTNYNAPTNLGIYPVNYSLYDDTLLLQEEKPGERFAVKVDIPVGEYLLGDFSSWATAESEKIPFGSDAVFTIFLRNSTASPFTGKVMISIHNREGPYWALIDSITNVEISPDTFITLSYSRPVDKSGYTYFGLYKTNTLYYNNFFIDAITSCRKGVWVVPAQCEVTMNTDREMYFKNEYVHFNINASSDIEDTCSLNIKVLDFDNHCLDSLSFNCYLDSTSIYTYTDSFKIDTSWDDGQYSIKAKFYYKEYPICWRSTHFNVKTGLVNTTLIPDTIIIGEDTMRLAIKIAPDTLTVFNSLLRYNLECPSDTFSAEFIVDSMKSLDTLNIATMIPDSSLAFGNYNFKYTLFSLDTIQGNYNFLHRVMFGLWSKENYYNWGDTLNIGFHIKNWGRVVSPIWLISEVEKPLGNFLDSVEINIGLDTDTIVNFQTIVDSGIPENSYKLWTRVRSGKSVLERSYNYRVILRRPDIMLTTDTTDYSIGDTVTVILYNAGELEGDVRLTDVLLEDVQHNFFPLDTARYQIPGGEFAFYEFTVPEVMSGPYYLKIMGNEENFDIPIGETEYVQINGIKVDITLNTSKDIYRPADSIISQANFLNGEYDFYGDMDLFIAPHGLYPGDTTFIPGSDLWPMYSSLYYSPGCTLSNNRVTLTGLDKLYEVDYWGITPGMGREGKREDPKRGMILKILDAKKRGKTRGDEPIRYAALASYNGELFAALTTDIRRSIFGPYPDFYTYSYELSEIASIYQFAMDGNYFYILDRDSEYVYKVSRGSGNIEKRWEVSNPSGIGVYNNSLYIVDEVNHSILKTNLNGDTLLIFGTDSLVEPKDIAMDSTGRIFVSDLSKEKVYIFNDSGSCIGTEGSGKFSQIAVDNKGYLYGADVDSLKVIKYDEDGNLVEYYSYNADEIMASDSLIHCSRIYTSPYVDYVLCDVLTNYGRYKGYSITSQAYIPGIRYVTDFSPAQSVNNGEIKWYFTTFIPEVLPWTVWHPIDSLPYFDLIETNYEYTPYFKAVLSNPNDGIAPEVEKFDIHYFTRRTGDVIWQDSVDLDFSPLDSVFIQKNAGVFADSGQFMLWGDIDLTNGQHYPSPPSHNFYIEPSPLSLCLRTDREIYYPGEDIVTSAIVVNNGDSAYTDINLKLLKRDEVVFDTLFTLLEPQSACTVSVILTDSSSFVFTGLLQAPGFDTLKQYKDVVVQPPYFELLSLYPDSVNHRPFEVVTAIMNWWQREVNVVFRTACGDSAYLDTMILEPEEERAIGYQFSISKDETLTTEILHPIEVVKTYPIRFGEKLEIRIDSVISSESNVLIPYYAKNSGEFDCIFDLHLTLEDTAGGVTDSISYTHLLPIGDSLNGEWGVNLDYGRYLLYWDAEPESSSIILSQGSTGVHIIPHNIVTIDSIILFQECDSMGNLVFDVPVVNNSANTFYGNVGLYADFIYETQGVELGGFALDTIRFMSNAVLEEGKHSVTGKILHNGEPLFERTDSLYFSSLVFIDSLPQELTFTIGDTAEVYITTKNRGTAIGEGELRFEFGEFGGGTRQVDLVPGESNVDTFLSFLPQDLQERTYYASVWLGDEEFIIPIHILGYKIYVDASLNQPNFANGDTVMLYLDISNRNQRNLKGFSVANYNGEVTEQEFLLSGYEDNIDFSNPEYIKAKEDSGTYISAVTSVGSFDSLLVIPEGGGTFDFRTRLVEEDSVHYSEWMSDSVVISVEQALLLQYKVRFYDAISYLERITLRIYDSLTVRDTVIETFSPVDLIQDFSFSYDSLANLMFYGVYTQTGRGLWLSTIRVFGRNDTCNIITDRQQYDMGDTVSATVQTPYNGKLDWGAEFEPFGTISDSLWVDSLTNQFRFTLPEELSSGSYSIDFAFCIEGDTGKSFSSSQPFDVRGYDVDVYECNLDTNEYLVGDSMFIRFKLNSNKPIPLITRLRFEQNYQWYDGLTDTVNVDSGFNYFDMAIEVPDLERGAAFLNYSFYKDSIFLAHSTEGFMVYVPDTLPPVAQFVDIPGSTYDPNTTYNLRITATDETRIYDILYYYNGYMKNHIVHESQTDDTLIYKIPSQPRGTNIAYYIGLSDSFGNETRLPEVDYEQFWVLSPVPPTECETDTVAKNIEISWARPGEELIYHSGYPYQSKIDTFALRFTPQYFPARIKSISVYADKTIPDTGIVNVEFYSVDEGLPGVEVYPSRELKITEEEANWVELQLDSFSVTDEIFIVLSTDGVQLFGDGNKDVYRTLIKDNLWTTDTTFGNLLAQAECFYEPESIFYRVMKEDSLQFVVIVDSLTDRVFTDTTVYGERRYRYIVQTHYEIPDLNGTSQILSQMYDYTPPVFGDSVAVYESDSGYFVGCEITDGIGIAMDSLIYNDTGTGNDSIVNNWYWYTIPKDIKDLRRASSATPNWNSETRFAHLDMEHPHSFVFTQDRLGPLTSRERRYGNPGRGLLLRSDSLITYYFIAGDSAGNLARNPDSGYFYIIPPAPEGFSGHITQDTTWSTDIVIKGDVWVDSGVVLTVEAGVNVRFIPHLDDEYSGVDTTRSEFIVDGDIRLLGCDSLPVIFTSNGLEPASGDYYGLRFENPDSSITIEYAGIKYAEQGIYFELNKPFKVKNCEISFCNKGINSASRFTKITDVDFLNNKSGAIINDGFLNMVKRCEFTGNVTGLVLNSEDSEYHPHLNPLPSRKRKIEEGIYSTGIASVEDKERLLTMTSSTVSQDGSPVVEEIGEPLAMTQQHKGYLYNANADQGLLFQISPSPLPCGIGECFENSFIPRGESSPIKGEEIERRMAISLAPEGKFQLALVYDNIFQSNDTGMVFSDCAIGMVRKNEFTSNNIGVYITDNGWPILGIRMSGKNMFSVDSDTLDTLQNYAVYNNTSFYILAEGNWWSTNDEDSISAIIWDYYDDENLGIVDFTPFRKTSKLFGGNSNSGAQTVSEKSVISKFKFVIPSLVNGSNIKVSSSIPRDAEVTIVMYDVSGRLKRRIKRIENKGNKSFLINCGQLRDGIYFIRFKVEGYSVTKKVIVLR
jgi:hypothetical protein